MRIKRQVPAEVVPHVHLHEPAGHGGASIFWGPLGRSGKVRALSVWYGFTGAEKP